MFMWNELPLRKPKWKSNFLLLWRNMVCNIPHFMSIVDFYSSSFLWCSTDAFHNERAITTRSLLSRLNISMISLISPITHLLQSFRFSFLTEAHGILVENANLTDSQQPELVQTQKTNRKQEDKSLALLMSQEFCFIFSRLGSPSCATTFAPGSGVEMKRVLAPYGTNLGIRDRSIPCLFRYDVVFLSTYISKALWAMLNTCWEGKVGFVQSLASLAMLDMVTSISDREVTVDKDK